MLGSRKPVAFIVATSAARAQQFYGGTLGLRLLSQDNYAVVFDANGVKLRVSIMPGHQPAAHTVLGWEVPDIASAMAELTKAGVAFERYSFLDQDQEGVWTTPDGLAKVAWFKDLDGNVLSVTQH